MSDTLFLILIFFGLVFIPICITLIVDKYSRSQHKYAVVILALVLVIESYILNRGFMGFKLKENISQLTIFAGIILFIVSIITSILLDVAKKRRNNSKNHIKKRYFTTYIIFSVIITTVLLFSLDTFINPEFVREDLTRQVIINHFTENIESFERVSQYLSKHPEKIKCYIDNNKLQVIKADEDYNYFNYQINDSVIKENIYFILKDLKYKRIESQEKGIMFLFHPVQKENGYENGIIYFEGEVNEESSVYYKIFDNWYYFFFGYV